MPAYLLANLRVTDQARYDEYRAQVPAVISQYGGRFLVRGGAVTPVEGDPGLARLVIVEFGDMAALRRFYDSPEYAPLIRLRQEATTGTVAFLEGL
jgi:uncharacterized protein (DUF1330 family)